MIIITITVQIWITLRGKKKTQGMGNPGPINWLQSKMYVPAAIFYEQEGCAF